MVARMPVRRRYLVIQLKRLRREAGLSQDEVWKALGWSRAKLQRLEAGDFQRLKAGDIMALCQVYKADKAVAEELIQIARDSRAEKPWWIRYKDVLPGAFLGLEAEATLIQEYNIALVPGLLQTRDYATALMRTSVDIHGEEEVQRRQRFALNGRGQSWTVKNHRWSWQSSMKRLSAARSVVSRR